MIALAEARNDYDWAHTISLVLLIGRGLQGGKISKAELEEIKPGGG